MHFSALEVDFFRPRSPGGKEWTLGARVNCLE